MPHRTPTLLAALVVAVLAGAASAGPPKSSPAGRGPCAALERVLGVLEWQEAQRRGPALLGNSRDDWRRSATRVLARNFADRCVTLNQIQVLGSHNSYHVEPERQLFDLIVPFDSQVLGWEYTHLPLDQQFAFQGIRQLELDVFADPEGGLYARPIGLQILEMDPDLSVRIPELEPPGIKVLHVQDLDYRTTCLSLIECLVTIKAWSDANPEHLPIFVMIEAKDEPVPPFFGLPFAVPLLWDVPFFDDLDAEILSVFPPEQLILPDDVRRNRATLEEAVLEDGWPTLGQARGKVFFGLDNGGAKREAYRSGSPALEGLVLFTNSFPGQADAAFVKRNDPIGEFDAIQELVAEGYLVRTRADADTVQARTGDTTRRDAALASGAQFVSTDYPEPDPRFGTGYAAEIPGGFGARCNPVNAPVGCRDAALEPELDGEL